MRGKRVQEKGCAYLPWGARVPMGRKVHNVHCNPKLRTLPFAKEPSCTLNSPAGKEKGSRLCGSAFYLSPC